MQHGEVGEDQERGELEVKGVGRRRPQAVPELQRLPVGERCKMGEVGDWEAGTRNVQAREGRERACCSQHILIEAVIIISAIVAVSAAPVLELQVQDRW